MWYQSSRRIIKAFIRGTRWTRSMFRQKSCTSGPLTYRSSGHRAIPWTRILGRSSRPVPVGSENSIATRGSRRTWSAFRFRPMAVPTTNRPSSRWKSGVVGQVIGVPSFATVESSHVW